MLKRSGIYQRPLNKSGASKESLLIGGNLFIKFTFSKQPLKLLDIEIN